jgi:hypothetical protein
MSASSPRSGYEFDVAVSFAGEDRDYVESIVTPLKAIGVRVFYDSDFTPELWGEDLVEYLDDVYRNKSRYAVMFISSHYASKMWTRHERRSALARGLTESRAYVLPVRLDDTPLDGLRPTVAYLDARTFGVDGIVQAIRAKLEGKSPVEETLISRVPRTEAERQQLLLARPDGWEFLYFAAEILHGRDGLESKYRDHQLQYAPRSGDYIPREGIPNFVGRGADDAQRTIAQLTQLLNEEVVPSSVELR